MISCHTPRFSAQDTEFVAHYRCQGTSTVVSFTWPVPLTPRGEIDFEQVHNLYWGKHQEIEADLDSYFPGRNIIEPVYDDARVYYENWPIKDRWGNDMVVGDQVIGGELRQAILLSTSTYSTNIPE